MFGSASHLVWTLVFGWIPIGLLLVIVPAPVLRHRRAIVKVTLVVSLLTILWDNAAIALGVWSYRPDRLLGIYLFRSPIETLLLGVTVAFGVASLTAALHARR